jgi:hypothetical protein
LHPFPPGPFTYANHPANRMVCIGESSYVLFGMYPNRMVWSPHECCLLKRGNEILWMDDPSQPQPQHKHLRRISPAQDWLMRQNNGARQADRCLAPPG